MGFKKVQAASFPSPRYEINRVFSSWSLSFSFIQEYAWRQDERFTEDYERDDASVNLLAWQYFYVNSVSFIIWM